LTTRVHSIDRAVGGLTAAWAKKTGLTAGIPVAVGAFDAHLGAVGSGVAPGTLVKIIGTSTCDIAVWPSGSGTGILPVSFKNKKATHGQMPVPLPERSPDIPGLCGIVDGSVLPGYFRARSRAVSRGRFCSTG